MRIRQRRLLVIVGAIALAASALPFPGSAPAQAVVPRPADQALARPAGSIPPGDY
jgi:hypothetical protein